MNRASSFFSSSECFPESGASIAPNSPSPTQKRRVLLNSPLSFREIDDPNQNENKSNRSVGMFLENNQMQVFQMNEREVEMKRKRLLVEIVEDQMVSVIEEMSEASFDEEEALKNNKPSKKEKNKRSQRGHLGSLAQQNKRVSQQDVDSFPSSFSQSLESLDQMNEILNQSLLDDDSNRNKGQSSKKKTPKSLLGVEELPIEEEGVRINLGSSNGIGSTKFKNVTGSDPTSASQINIKRGRGSLKNMVSPTSTCLRKSLGAMTEPKKEEGSFAIQLFQNKKEEDFDMFELDEMSAVPDDDMDFLSTKYSPSSTK